MISSETCRMVMDAYRNGEFTGRMGTSDGSSYIRLGDIAQLRHTTDGSFEVSMGGHWIRVDSIEWRSGIHINFPGAQLIVHREDA